MSLRRRAVSSLVALLAVTPVWAQEASQPVQELFRTELVFPQASGELQITVVPSRRIAEGRSRIELPLAMEYGLTDRWQVEAKWAVRSAALSLGSQYSFLNVVPNRVHLAVGVEGDLVAEEGEDGRELETSSAFAIDVLRRHGMQLFGAVTLSPTGIRRPGFDLGVLSRVGGVVVALEAGTWRRADDDGVELVPSLTAPLATGWELGIGAFVEVERGLRGRGFAVSLTRELE